jgi:cytochrome c peroxidase
LISTVCALSALPAMAADRPNVTQDMFPAIEAEEAALGQLLFYDPILSGNRNISCGTCHHHDHFSADGVSLSIGEGGEGVGPKRRAVTGANAIKKRVPRHAPALWNIGANEFRVFFHDGRVSASDDYGNGINSPAEEWLPEGLDSLLAAQALFPMTAQFEMAGNPSENEIAGAVHDRIDMAWPILAKRVRGIETYRMKFAELGVGEASISDIANALAAFMGSEWRSFDSPYDKGAMTAAQTRGADLFFGEAGCSACHSGPFFTDQKFHALALPAFGPGRTRIFDPMPRDVGRMGESNELDDAYRFRTPSLRNVALTAPYGHNGAYPTLEGIIRHHLDPLDALGKWQPQMANLPSVPWLQNADFIIQQDAREMARLRASFDVTPQSLSDDQIADLVAFMGALSGGDSRFGRLGRPETVPSGLAVD